jgi:hypothetical protein
MGEPEKQLTRQEILALIPEGTVRVKVVDEKGGERWRDVENGFHAILDTDNVPLVGGIPRTSMKHPGRRPKTPQAASPKPANAAIAAAQAEKREFLKKHPLIKQLIKGVDSEDVLHLTMMGFAQEAASLGFERHEAERNGKETSQLSIRKINALKAIAETWIKRKEQIAGKSIDMHSQPFKRMFDFMLETFRESMLKGGIPFDQVETIFVSLSERIEDETWELEARNRMKG